jgi:EmrB/QacA subfamily drug resistance transporter
VSPGRRRRPGLPAGRGRLGRPRFQPSRRTALAAVSAVLFITFLDNTIVSVALADIQTALGVGVAGLQWIVDGYMLAFAALMLTGGTLGDLLGRKKVMLAGVGVFCAGSVVAALAQSGGMLIGARVAMGVGAAASEPGTLSLIRQIYPEREARARALGVWAAVSGLALALGPVVGGLLIAALGWRSVFWFGVILGLAALAVAAKTVPESRDPEGRRLDLPGLLAGAAAVTAATFAVISGESAGYGTWWIVLLFAAALVAALAFVAIERHAADPVLELSLLRHPTFSAANVVAFGTSVSVFSVFFFTALYLQLISSFSGWQIALTFVSLAVAMVVAGPLAGRWTARRGPRGPMTVGCLLAGAGLDLLDHVLAPGVSIGTLAWVLAIAGLGFGAAVVASNAAVLTVVPGRRSGMAASTVNTARELGGVFGVAVLGAIVDAQLTTGLSDKLRALGIPPNFRSIVIDAVTHGGGISASQAAQNPAAQGHLTLVLKVLGAAEDAAGRGVHNALLVAAAIVFASAAVALVAVRR